MPAVKVANRAVPETAGPNSQSTGDGSRTKAMGMFLQDPTLPDLYQDFRFPLDRDYLEGTGSSKFVIRDADVKDLPLYAAPNWAEASDLSFAHFESQGLIDNPQFHQVNTFAVLTHTLALVEEELGRGVEWKAGGPLVVRPHAMEEMNTYYFTDPPSINFGYFTSPFRRTPVWTCLSHDVVAHELGHAVLDNFRPLFVYSSEFDTYALHESIGDLLALFSALQHKAVVRRLFQDSGGDLRKASLITQMGEEFGVGFQGGGFPFLRSTLDVIRYNAAPKEAHARSVVWTGAVYEILVRLVEATVSGGERAWAGKRKAEWTGRDQESFERFVQAVVEASRWVKGMLIRAFHYMAPTGVTMPVLARLIYEADARVFPTDGHFREVARAVFEERELWMPSIDLTAPDLGAEFERLQGGESSALAQAVVRHAAELRIPLGMGARILNPRIVTTTRRVDKVKDERGVATLRTITEHYLNYAYELIFASIMVNEKGVLEPISVAVYKGGTLVMDENWKAVLLITDPVALAEDANQPDPAVAAITRAVERFQSATRRASRTLNPGPDPAGDGLILRDQPGCPFVIKSQASGPARLVRRTCDLREHLRGISQSQTVQSCFPFATSRG